MSEPEVKLVVDEYGRIGYRVTDEGVLLSKDEKEFIANHILHLQAENAKLREQIHYLMKGDLLHVLTDQEYIDQCERERLMQVSIDALDKENEKFRELCEYLWEFAKTCGADHPLLRELGVEVDE